MVERRELCFSVILKNDFKQKSEDRQEASHGFIMQLTVTKHRLQNNAEYFALYQSITIKFDFNLSFKEF